MLKQEHVDILLALGKQDIIKHVAPPVDCEVCGKTLPTHADARNYAMIGQVGVPGHPSLALIHCPLPEHWACSINCWKIMSARCLTEHILPLLIAGEERVHGSTNTH